MLTLKQFLHPVPICQSSITIEEITTLFRSGNYEQVVMVDCDQKPLGMVSSHYFLSLLLQQSFEAMPSLSRFSENSTQVSQSLTLNDLENLLTPLVLIPYDLKVIDFSAYLQDKNVDPRTSPTYGLVNDSGNFQGLFDSRKMLKAFLTQTFPIASQLSSLVTSGSLLIELLEQFPLPVMLQTKQGNVIQRNRTWREQIGELIPSNNASTCSLSSQKLQSLSDQVVAVGQTLASHFPSPYYLADRSSLTTHPSYSQWFQSIPEKCKPQEPINDTNSLHPPLPSPSSLISPNLGKERVWKFVKCPLSTEDEEVSLVLATDVTEQQRLCRELAAKNADLVQLNRLKDEFLACISHELKSPLTAVVGLSSLLREQKVGKLNSRQIHYAQSIYRSGRQLMTIVNDLLDLTHLETGQLKLTFISLNIQSVCERAYHSIAEKYQDKIDNSISFFLEIEPGLEFFLADELRLHQMLVNLLDNAIKFSKSGGSVGIKVNYWEDWVAFNVWDTGIGIPEESQHLIFQKFQQLENPLTSKFEGTGLGLILTQRLARAHGGEISFISKAGQGSQFTLLLPPDAKSQDKKHHHQSSPSSYPLVLIVEAIPQCIENLMSKLSELGYRVVIARTGTEAVEKARRLRPYAILLNPLLPLLSGWDVLTLLKSDPQTRKIRVFMTTTENRQPFKEPNQADGFVSVPLDSSVLKTIFGEVNPLKKTSDRALTLLSLCPNYSDGKTSSVLCSPLDWALTDLSSQLNHRILEGDDLEQAQILTSVWQVDVVILDGRYLDDPTDYVQLFSEQPRLAELPLVTLDLKTTEAANRVENLSVFPCLIPRNQKNTQQLWQVISIAASSTL
ncbi:MAG: ATP-binding response regulator [cyanobacterium endosymbiont of Rhopalodia musculus]|uniref:ATP-binding response regulator n=1 Tax=cyanobacterium endosymbiont of Epithemia clementina EcSB TaxID=3034674 RepID=UPI002481960E|nr:ATP-binding protein [cyanobacterium endosymbiont of Epithemia clementina EcSB]WGT67805.1 ATP-binding protein [cyanobacterium endosymbiont of Epithemia clementina EcSB]